mmetsp:Transcript_27538/g.89691  ORF Transcript_27538/g.89691 Transcript_27538/m.89691 type:complete len:219 (-) Transcript_27538:1239-1895(-)
MDVRGGVVALKHVPIRLCDLPEEQAVVSDVDKVCCVRRRVVRPEIVRGAYDRSCLVRVETLGRVAHAVDAVAGAEVPADRLLHHMYVLLCDFYGPSVSLPQHCECCLRVNFQAVNIVAPQVGVKLMVELEGSIPPWQPDAPEGERVPGELRLDLKNSFHRGGAVDGGGEGLEGGGGGSQPGPVPSERMPAQDLLYAHLSFEGVDKLSQVASRKGLQEP